MELFGTKSGLGKPLTVILALAVGPVLSMAKDPSAAKTIYDIPNLVVREIQSTNALLTTSLKPLTEKSDDRRRVKTVEQADLAFLHEDFAVLGWPEDNVTPPPAMRDRWRAFQDFMGRRPEDNVKPLGNRWYVDAVSNDGKILYTISYTKWDQSGGERRKKYECATIVFDPTVPRKLIIRYVPVSEPERKAQYDPGHVDYTQLSPDGKILFIGLNDIKINPRYYDNYAASGTAYFIRLADMTVLYQHRGCTAGDSSKNRFSDDSTIYFTGDGLLDIYAAKFKPINWRRWHPAVDSTNEFVISPNFQYIVAVYGVFAATSTVEGQWGLEVHTPEGHFNLTSPIRSLSVSEVKNDGTIVDDRGFVFVLEAGTYRCIHEPAQLPLGRLDVVKEGGD